MSKIYIIIFLLASTLLSRSQSISVSKNQFGAFIEIDNKLFAGSVQGCWITNQTNLSLQNTLNKAIDWAGINSSKRMEFDKEITRFRVMEKSTYEFYRRYIPEFSQEAKVIFAGSNDGSFKCTIYFANMDDLVFDRTENIRNFINILQGKSGNPSVDKVFH